MKLTVISKFDERYTEDSLQEMVKQLNEKTTFVLPENDFKSDVIIENVCGEVVKGSATVEDNQIKYQTKIFSTDMGRAVKQLLQENSDKISVGILSIGTVKEDNKIDSNDLTVNKVYMEETDNSNILEIE